MALPFCSRLFRAVSGASALFLFAATAFPQTCTTSITGKVYSPLGTNGGDPIPNILVYVVDPNFAPPVFTPGVTGGCSAQDSLVPSQVIASTTTDASGTFTITNPQLATVSPFTVVIQAGKWRRQYTMANPTACTLTTLPTMAMPASQADGDMPKIAISTGSADAVECIFKQIGIKTSEFTLPTGNGSINLYVGEQTATTGGELSPDATTANPTPTETTLVNSASILDNYDVVVFGCQGTSTATEVTTANDQNLVDFANAGGRIFATHYGYIWLDNIKPFSGTAAWAPSKEVSLSGNYVATIDTKNNPQGATLAQWIQNVGASYNNTLGQVSLSNVRIDYTSLVAPPSVDWVTMNKSSSFTGTPSIQYTFDTPINTTTTPTVSLAFTNSPSIFTLGDTADTINVAVTNSSGADADASLNMTVELPAGFSIVSMNGTGSGTGWVCQPATLQCNRTSPLTAGSTDTVQLVVAVSQYAQVGQQQVSAAMSGGGLSGTNQCGRVLYNDYHVEGGGSKIAYPASCGTGSITAQQKFLEYALYNLTNFVAPVTATQISVQSPTTTTLTNVVTPIYYGQIIADQAVEQVTGLNSVAVDGGKLDFLIDGTIVCTLPAQTAGVCPPPTGQGYNAGNHTVQSTYEGDTEFLTSSSPVYTVVVMPDPTTTSLTVSTTLTPPNQPVTLTGTVTDAYTTVAGLVGFYDNGSLYGTATVMSGNVATLTTSGLLPGSHNITACMIASQNYLGSCSAPQVIIVTVPYTPTPTVTLVASNNNPSIVGQNVTFSANVATTGAFITVPAGTVTFYDGSTVLSTGTLDAKGNASFSTTTLAVGTHPITVAYAGAKATTGSTSAVLSQVVNSPLTSAGTGFLLNVTPGTFSVGAGAQMALTVQVTELNNFLQPVNLTCQGLPSETQCNFGATQLPAVGGTTQLSVTPSAATQCGSSTPIFVAGFGKTLTAVGAVFSLALLALRRRRKLLRGLAVLGILALLPAINGCGSGNCTDFGVKPGTYTFSVVGTSVPGSNGGGMTKSQTMTMTVTIK